MNERAAEILRAEAARLRDGAAAIGLPFPAPSPLQRAEGLASPWSRGTILVKRDDLLGPGGTKVRKLAQALPAARSTGARRVLTFGHVDSNHALVTAAAARAAGLKAELWLQQRSPDELPERRRLAEELAEVHYRGSFGALVAGAGRSLLRHPRTAVLLPGGTGPATSAAVAPLVLEVVEQLGALGEPVPPRWVVPAGSGGTVAGLWAGVRALELPVRITAYQASDPLLVRPSLIAALANRALDRLGLPGHVDAAEVALPVSQIGAGHGLETEASRRAREEWAAVGLPLDPIYGAKAAAGLREEIARADAGSRWLFLITGARVGP